MTRLREFMYDQRFNVAKVLTGVFAVIALYALIVGLSYSKPMVREEFQSASESWVADQPMALYDAGLQAYKAEKYPATIKLLIDAYNGCLDANGGVTAKRKQLAADIKFVSANALVKTKKMKAAIDAYKDCLRLDSENMEAKNNLESLLQMNNGKGPPDDAPASGPGGGPKRGI